MKIRNRVVNRLLARLACGLLRGLFATCRIEVQELAPHTSPYEPQRSERYLYCLWHDAIVLNVFAGKNYDLAALVSRHRDGGYLADAMQMVGVHPVRGSSSRGGAEAVREIVAELEGWHVAITPDGPRGPRRKIKPGILWLAAKTGRAIVPAVGVCSNAWEIQGSWTTLTIPKPFSHVLMLGGEKIHVPTRLTRDSLAQHAERLEAEMIRLEILARQLLAGDTVVEPPQSAGRKAA